MPIYEFACPKCRVVFNFLFKRLDDVKQPKCPRCGNRKMAQQVSRFAISRGGSAKSSTSGTDGQVMPDFNDPNVERAMQQLEREMVNMDENDPRQMAHVMRRIKDLMPSGSAPPELDVAIRRLEAGEDPERIEEDMGDVLGELMGPNGPGASGDYTHDDGLYDG